MNINENDFFREVTMRICSSLFIEKSLWRALNYIKTIMPVTGMNLHLFEQDMTEMRTIAYATFYDKREKLPLKMGLSKEATAKLKYGLWKTKNVIIVNQPEANPVIHSVLKKVGKSKMSVMLMSLEIEGRGLGGLAIFADGLNLYKKEHSHLFSLIHEPFAIAMSNALQHMELLNHKNMLIDDLQYMNRELLHISGDVIVGEKFGLNEVMESVRRVAPLESPVLLLGETGVGKEVIANAIHFLSPRKKGPFIKVNCGAIPESLLDSELFGHEMGAFTGAVKQNRGRFERANGGSILLDEIAELPLHAQIRFLRVLQEKKVERVGGTKSIPVDIRIIASTHQDLEKMISINQFRKDLWFRFNVYPIIIPPLRERKEDIPALVQHFIERKYKGMNYHAIPTVSGGVISQLKNFHWPGNVRELENAVERALIQYQGRNKKGRLTFEDFMLPQQKSVTPILSEDNNKLLKIDEVMRMHIQQALKVTNGKIHGQNGAAELLDINPYTLRARMKKHGIFYKKKL